VEAMIFVLLGAFLGMVGGIIHLLTIRDPAVLQIATSMMLGCAVGTIAGIALLGVETSCVLFVALIALGYAGTDLIMSLLGR
jgi:hypothetical protein